MEDNTAAFIKHVTIEYQTFEKKYNHLIAKRFPKEKTLAQKSFESLLLSELWTAHCTHFDGIELLDTLTDDENLSPAKELEQNFTGNINDILSDKVKNNKSLQKSMPRLLAFSAKGVGNGELILPLLIKGWTKTKSSDGNLNGMHVEIKKFSGGSMKPNKKGSANNGHIDTLNKNLFGGNPPMQTKKAHQEHIRTLDKIQDKKETYLKYLSQILDKEKNEVEPLAQELLENIADFKKCRRIYGTHVLKAYKEIDGFDIIMLIDPETGDIVSITDFENIPQCVEFTPKMTRNDDTQAVPDGYVNIKVKKKSNT